MITCTLGEKKYTVDYITGRALREMEPAAKMYAKIVAVANAAAKGETVPEEQQFTICFWTERMLRVKLSLFSESDTTRSRSVSLKLCSPALVRRNQGFILGQTSSM